MKTKFILIPLVSLMLLAQPFHSQAAGQKKSAIGLGARSQVKHSVMKDLPFEDGDITYTASYEYHDAAGYWQLMVGYTPDVGDGDVIDYVITPQLNLIIQDKIFLAGTGILGSYISDKETGSDWTDVYWQLMLGLEIPVGPLSIEAMASYQFDKWGNLSDFEFDDITYGGSLKFYF